MSIVRYHLQNAVATITMDDGNANVISPQMLRELNKALDRAAKDKAVVVLTGREDVFCAGFDLKILKIGVLDALAMLVGGFKLSRRLLSFPMPVVIACNGHAMAMGAFLLLSGDYRLAAQDKDSKIVTNEVAIGLTMPLSGVEICRQRLAPAHFVRATLLAENYTPCTAVEAGFVDRVVPATEVLPQGVQFAERLTQLDMRAHYQSKLRARRQLLKALKSAIFRDRIDFVLKGLKRLF